MRDYGHGPDDRTGDKLMRSCRNDRTEAARRTCRCLLQSRMTVDHADAVTTSAKMQSAMLKIPLDTNAPDKWVQGPPGDSLPPEAIGAVMEVTKWLEPSNSGHELVTARVCRPQRE